MRRTLIALSLLALAGSAHGQDKKLTLRWYGQSFFQLETASGQKIVFDPHAIPNFGRHTVSANVALISHPHNDHNQLEILTDSQAARVFEGVTTLKSGKTDWNKIDEKVIQTRIRTLGTYHDAMGGMQRGKNAVFIVEADGLVFCHLGDLGHDLTPEQVKAIGKVDVLMVPVGGIYTINGETARKVVAAIKPRLYVVPMHYAVPGYDDLLGPDEFLDEIPKEQVKRTPETNELVIPADVKAPDAPTVVLLGWKKADEPKKKP
jgi:L-ascorbate metabolism protein UlaG (beta-lactamase superfamily)